MEKTDVADELTANEKQDLLKEKRKAYFKSRFDVDMDYKIALRLNDEALKQRCLDSLKRIEQAIDLINEEIAKPG